MNERRTYLGFDPATGDEFSVVTFVDGRFVVEPAPEPTWWEFNRVRVAVLALIVVIMALAWAVPEALRG